MKLLKWFNSILKVCDSKCEQLDREVPKKLDVIDKKMDNLEKKLDKVLTQENCKFKV